MNNIVPSDPELALVPFQPLPPDKNPALLYIARLNSKASRDSMRSALHRVARMLGYPGLEAVPWHLFTAAHVRLARAKLAERYPAVTTNHALVALRGVLRESFILGLTTNEDWNRIQLERGIPGSRLLAGRALEQSEITPLVGAVGADMGPLAVRNVALLAVLLGAGLRRAEAVSLDINSWDPSARQITVIGKGNKERIMPIGAAAAAAASAPKTAPSSCEAKAAEKKLAGAAKNSFVKKCEKDAAAAAPAAKAPDATTACNAKAAEKKLAGAAKNSFVKKCVADAGK